jgi:hypothetical protein
MQVARSLPRYQQTTPAASKVGATGVTEYNHFGLLVSAKWDARLVAHVHFSFYSSLGVKCNHVWACVGAGFGPD